MTHKRPTHYLLAAILCALFCILVVSSARASDFSWNAGGFVVGKIASGAGYKPGIGLNLVGAARYKFVELRVSGSALWQEKKQATFGYSYGLLPSIRFYVWKDFFVTSAYSMAGYTSYMKSGAEWSKSGQNLGFGGGYDDGKTGISLISYLQETKSPNNVQFTTLGFRQQIWEYVSVIAGLTYMTFDQVWSGETQQWSAWNWTVGIGFYF